MRLMWLAERPHDLKLTVPFDALSREDDDTELSDEELRDRIEEILAREVAPIASAHGGAIRVNSVRDGVLTVWPEPAWAARSARTPSATWWHAAYGPTTHESARSRRPSRTACG